MNKTSKIFASLALALLIALAMSPSLNLIPRKVQAEPVFCVDMNGDGKVNLQDLVLFAHSSFATNEIDLKVLAAYYDTSLGTYPNEQMPGTDPTEGLGAYNYIVWKYNTTYYAARNMDTMMVESITSSSQTTLQYALTAVTGGGSVFVRNASYTPCCVQVPALVHLVVDGNSSGITYSAIGDGAKIDSSEFTAGFGGYQGGTCTIATNSTCYAEVRPDNTIRSFGTNCSWTFQNAENNCTNGGQIDFQAKNYTFTNTTYITYPSITLMGSGVGGYSSASSTPTILHLGPKADCSLLSSSGNAYNLLLQNLWFDGNNASEDPSNTAPLITFGAGGANGNLKMYNDFVMYSSGIGVYIPYISDTTIQDCYFENNYNHNFEVVTSAWHVVFTDDTFWGSIKGCGIALLGLENEVNFIGCRAGSNALDGYRVTAAEGGQGSWNGAGLQWLGGSVFGNTQNGINLYGVSNAQIEDVDFHDNGQGTTNTYDNVYMQTYSGRTCNNNQVIGNQFYNSTTSPLVRYAIQIADGSNNQIAWNQINGTATAPLVVTASSGNLVQNNVGYATQYVSSMVANATSTTWTFTPNLGNNNLAPTNVQINGFNGTVVNPYWSYSGSTLTVTASSTIAVNDTGCCVTATLQP